MILALNEIETTILKAARGAGMEWGLAEEAAAAAGWLARFRLPWAAPLLRTLEATAWRTPPVLDGTHLRPNSADGFLCPILCGAYLSDLRDNAPLTMERVLFPILLLPFAARRGTPFELSFDDVTLMWLAGEVAVAPKGLCRHGLERAGLVTLRPSAYIPPTGTSGLQRLRPGCAGGVVVAAEPWARLQRLEALTYVPASSQSRRRGAGPAGGEDD
jgi:hypothetical protein